MQKTDLWLYPVCIFLFSLARGRTVKNYISSNRATQLPLTVRQRQLYMQLRACLITSETAIKMDNEFQLFTSLRFDWIMKSLPDLHPRNLGWNSESPSSLYMLTYHRDRMLKAATHWGWTGATKVIEGEEGLGRLNQFVTSTLQARIGERWGPDCEPMRVKVVLSKNGNLALEYSPVPATNLSNLFPQQLPAPEGHEDPRSSVGEQQQQQQQQQQQPLGPMNLTPPYDIYIDTDFTSPSEFTHFKTTKRAMYDEACQRVGLKPSDATKEVLIVNKETGVIMEGSRTTPYFWKAEGWVTPRVARLYEAQDGAGGQDGTTRRWALERNLAIEGDVRAAELVDGEAVWLSNGVRGFVFGRIRRPSDS